MSTNEIQVTIPAMNGSPARTIVVTVTQVKPSPPEMINVEIAPVTGPHEGYLNRPTTGHEADQDAVYTAEETWQFEAADMGYLDSQPDGLQPEQVSAFAVSTMQKAGWKGTVPTIEFDVPDEHHFAGWYSGRDHVIHLHSRLLSPTTVLHELTHWLDNRDRHGPIFQGNFVSLIDAAYGEDASRLLLDHYVEHGLTPDPWRLPKWAEDLRRHSLGGSVAPGSTPDCDKCGSRETSGDSDGTGCAP